MLSLAKLVAGLLLLCIAFLLGYGYKEFQAECNSGSCSVVKTIQVRLLQLGSGGPSGDSHSNWGPQFELASIASTSGAANQPAYFYKTKSLQPKPLVVSLHSWSGDYQQHDPLADQFSSLDWNYIHPDFRGPNNTIDGCLSNLVIQDIDDVIRFMVDMGSVDVNNIFVVGVSGGGYTALGHYLKSGISVNAYLAWVPISNLHKWHTESLHRSLPYAKDIEKCTSEAGDFDAAKIAEKSPYFMDATTDSPTNSKLELYAGLFDGYRGSVPISHSVSFFNKLATERGYNESKIPENKVIDLLSLTVSTDESIDKIGDRAVYLHAKFPAVSLTIFDGDHEMITEHVIERLKRLASD